MEMLTSFTLQLAFLDLHGMSLIKHGKDKKAAYQTRIKRSFLCLKYSCWPFSTVIGVQK